MVERESVYLPTYICGSTTVAKRYRMGKFSVVGVGGGFFSAAGIGGDVELMGRAKGARL
jgi:hypothetical protein